MSPDVRRKDDPSQHAAALVAWFLRTVSPEWRRVPTSLGPWLLVPLFFLPWINISCNEQPMARQSGLQSLYGGFTLAPNIQRIMDQQKAMAVPNNPQGNEKDLKAYAIWPFPLFVLAGIFFGLVCIACVLFRARHVAAGANLVALGCGALCFLLLVAQMAMGFPLANNVRESNEKMRAGQQPGVFPLGNNPFGPAANRPNPAADLMNIDAEYTAWFWIEFLLCLASVPLLAIEVSLTSFQVGRLLLAGKGNPSEDEEDEPPDDQPGAGAADRPPRTDGIRHGTG